MVYKRCGHEGRNADRCKHPWYGSYQLAGRPRVRVALAKWTGRTITTKSEATTAFDELKAQIRANTFNPAGLGLISPAAGTGLTLSGLIASYKKDYVHAKQQRTAGDFEYRVKPLLDFFGPHAVLTDITDARIEALAAQLRRPRLFRGDDTLRSPSAASVNRPLSLLRRLLSWAEERALIAERPDFAFDKEDYSRWRRIDPAEEFALLNAASPRLKALLVVALDTGLRRGEMLKLRCNDVDLSAGTLTPRGSTTKDAEHRVLPIGTNRLRAVLEWFLADKQPLMPLIDDGFGDGLAGFKTAWENCRLKALGVPVERTKTANLTPACRQALRAMDLHWHDLRHEFACRLDDRGVALGVIQRLLGHADIKTTERYLRRGAKELAIGAMKLDDGTRINIELPAHTVKQDSAQCLKVSQDADSEGEKPYQEFIVTT